MGGEPELGQNTAISATPGRSVSIATVLAVSFGLLTAIGVASVLFIGISSNQKNTLGLLNRQVIMMVGVIETGVRNYLEPALEKGRFINRQVEAGFLDLGDEVQVRAALTGVLAGTPQIAAVIFVDRDLRRTAVATGPDGTAALIRIDGEQKQDVRHFLGLAREADAPFWGELVYDREQRNTFVNLIQPLHFNNEFKGFIGFVVSMTDLSDFITETGSKIDSTGFILYGSGYVLAHPNLTSPHPDLSDDNPVVAIGRVGDLVLANFESRVRENDFEVASAAGVAVDTLEVAGVLYVIFSAPITDFGPTPWTIGAYVQSDQVDAELDRLVYSAIAGLVVLAVSILAAVLVGKAIARPIRVMASSAAQIGALEFGAVEPLQPGRIRELRDQAIAFNRMLAGLRWFETYVPRTLVKRLIARGDGAAMASEERAITVMFTDIVGFSALSESMPASETADLLNEHFALLGACVEAEGGTIDKFIGDALMAFWGAPDDQPDHAARACRAAAAASSAMQASNAAHRQAGKAPVRVRIGIHTGPAVVGNIGAPGRMNYTTVGDAVNTAQRLEQLGKELDEGDDATILVSSATVAAAGDLGLALEQAGRFEVKGKQVQLDVCRLRPGPHSGNQSGPDSNAAAKTPHST